MTPNEVLYGLLDRLKVCDGGTLYVEGEETSGWPDGVLVSLTDAGIARPASPAHSVICDDCEEGCLMPVQRFPASGERPARLFVVCDKRADTSRVAVVPERLQQWQITQGQITNVLQRAAESAGIRETVVRDVWSAIELDQILSTRDGLLRIDKGALRAALTLLEPRTDIDIGNQFILTGQFWSVTFQGKTRTFENSLGIRYIEHLIRHQGKEVSVTDLYLAVRSVDSEAIDTIHSNMTADQLEEMALSVVDHGNAGEAIDEKTKQSLKTQLEKIKDLIFVATETGDTEQQARLEEEKTEIYKYLSSSLT